MAHAIAVATTAAATAIATAMPARRARTGSTRPGAGAGANAGGGFAAGRADASVASSGTQNVDGGLSGSTRLVADSEALASEIGRAHV